MGQHHDTLWLRPQDTAPSCAACLPAEGGPACRARSGGEPCLAPQFSGAEASLRRVIESLRSVVDADAGASIVDLHLVKSLRVEDGEAELTVTFPPGCDTARQLADDAFQAMRRMLPDTDIYVRHAA